MLEAQFKLSKFLRGLLDQVLRIDDSAESGSDLFYEEARRGLQLPDFTDLPSQYLSRPFLAPPKFSIEAILSIARTRVDIHSDHVQLLQIKPEYARRQISLHWENYAYLGFGKKTLNYEVAKDLVDEFNSLLIWQWILEEAEAVKKAKAIKSNHRKDFLESLALLETLLDCQIRLLSQHLRHIMPLRPGFSKNYTLSTGVKHGLMSTQYKANFVLNEILDSDRLQYCLEALLSTRLTNKITQGVTDTTLDVAMLFEMLEEHIVRCSKEGKIEEMGRLDELLYAKYSDLSAMHQILSIIKLHGPGIPVVNAELLAKRKQFSKGWRYVLSGFLAQSSTRTGTQMTCEGLIGYVDDELNSQAARIRLIEDIEERKQAFQDCLDKSQQLLEKRERENISGKYLR